MSDKEEKGKPEKPAFTIFVNNNPFTVHDHELTGAQIKTLAGIPADYELFEVKGDQTVTVGNDQEVHIHNHMHFRAIPAGTFGRYAAAA
jgi:Multiubiquitin